MPARLLVCTDLDRTLIPNGTQPESAGAREHFALLASRPQVTLAYVSGRDRGLVEDALGQYDLPVPDFVLGDVGTTIYRVGAARAWQRDAQWQREIAQDWNGLSHADLEQALRDLPELELQEAAKQNEYKLSFYLAPDTDRQALAQRIGQRLDPLAAKLRLIWSEDDAAGIGLLDLLPARASKLHAIEMLMRELEFSVADTVFCGDSGNDIEVLASDIPAVLVGNASCGVRAEARRLARQAGCEHRLYVACGDFMGMNANYAGGMLQGIAHYFPDSIAWMGFAAAEASA